MVVGTSFNFKRIVLPGTVVVLCGAALVGIYVFLFETDFWEDILFSVLAIGIFCLTGLCCYVLREKKRFLKLSLLGIFTSLLALILTLYMIWEEVDFFSYIGNITAIVIILSFATALSCLLLFLVHSYEKKVNWFLWATLFCLAITTILLIIAFTDKFDFAWEEPYLKITGVFGILTALGTIVTPILHKMYQMKPVRHR